MEKYTSTIFQLMEIYTSAVFQLMEIYTSALFQLMEKYTSAFFRLMEKKATARPTLKKVAGEDRPRGLKRKVFRIGLKICASSLICFGFDDRARTNNPSSM